jgi:RNA polymerase sigma-B factor
MVGDELIESPPHVAVEPDPDPQARTDEYAGLLPQLRLLASLAPDDPRRSTLRAEIILALLPVVRNIAARHSRSTPGARDELTQVGTVGLITAIDRWDSDRSHDSVLGYVVPCVRGEILRYFRDRTWSVRVSRRLKDLGVAINGATGPLTQALGRPPRPGELADHIGAPVEEVIEALAALESRTATSLDATTPDGSPLIEHTGALDAKLDIVEYEQALRPLLDALPDRERTILLLRFFGDRTQSQIAAQLGISQMHVSRLLSRTLRELRGALLDDSAPDAVVG